MGLPPGFCGRPRSTTDTPPPTHPRRERRPSAPTARHRRRARTTFPPVGVGRVRAPPNPGGSTRCPGPPSPPARGRGDAAGRGRGPRGHLPHGPEDLHPRHRRVGRAGRRESYCHRRLLRGERAGRPMQDDFGLSPGTATHNHAVRGRSCFARRWSIYLKVVNQISPCCVTRVK